MMRNCLPLPTSICRNRKALHVVKVDGEVIEFTTPVSVNELLIQFKGFGIKSSKNSSKLLPPSFQLQLGKTYYLLSLKSPDRAENHADSQSTKVEPSPETAVKRIKVVITKKQLEELLLKKGSVEKILLASSTDSGASWRPRLVSIPEENELI